MAMSLDRSLKSSSALRRHRNVLSRSERLEKLKEDERWEEGQSVFGLPKVANRKIIARKHKAPKAEGAEGVEGDEAGTEGAAEGAAPAAGAPGAGQTR
ncbi:MAG: small basic protein [Phycisphaerae bacterium]|nr:small basic protein [Phycisphaerae bacterium]